MADQGPGLFSQCCLVDHATVGLLPFPNHLLALSLQLVCKALRLMVDTKEGISGDEDSIVLHLLSLLGHRLGRPFGHILAVVVEKGLIADTLRV